MPSTLPGDNGANATEEETVPLPVIGEEEDAVITEAEDENVPLASLKQEEETDKRGFWWWIIPIVAAVTGKTAYDKKNKKGIFAEKEAVRNTDNSDRK